MGFVDERIALLEKASRQIEREEKIKAEEQLKQAQNEDELTLEEVREGINKNQLNIEEDVLTFETKWYFDEKLPLTIMQDFFDEVTVKEQAVLFASNSKGICIMCTYLEEEMIEESLKDRQKEMEENLKKMQVYAEVTKAKELKYVDYLCYRSPSNKGWIFNIVFWLHKGERRIVGNMNCLEKDVKTYGVMLEALVLEIEEKLE